MGLSDFFENVTFELKYHWNTWRDNRPEPQTDFRKYWKITLRNKDELIIHCDTVYESRGYLYAENDKTEPICTLKIIARNTWNAFGEVPKPTKPSKNTIY